MRFHEAPTAPLDAIVATALAMGLPVLTPDRHIAAYPGVEVRW